jgi:hypothetical protein
MGGTTNDSFAALLERKHGFDALAVKRGKGSGSLEKKGAPTKERPRPNIVVWFCSLGWK